MVQYGRVADSGRSLWIGTGSRGQDNYFLSFRSKSELDYERIWKQLTGSFFTCEVTVISIRNAVSRVIIARMRWRSVYIGVLLRVGGPEWLIRGHGLGLLIISWIYARCLETYCEQQHGSYN